MKKENQFEYTTNAALTQLEFSNLIARYKRAVYTKWVYEQLWKDQQEMDFLEVALSVNRKDIK